MANKEGKFAMDFAVKLKWINPTDCIAVGLSRRNRRNANSKA